MQEYYRKHRSTILRRLKIYNKKRYHNPNTKIQLIRKHGDHLYWGHGGGKYVHRVIAEGVLGRKLKRYEFVHHIDGNGLNNNHNNLIVCTHGYHNFLHAKKRNKLANGIDKPEKGKEPQ